MKTTTDLMRMVTGCKAVASIKTWGDRAATLSYFCLGTAIWISLSFTSFASSYQKNISGKAKSHYEKALAYEANSDVSDEIIEIEYKAAIKANDGIYPDAWRSYCWYLAARLRFSEATDAMKAYIRQTPNIDHASDQSILGELENAASLKEIISKVERPDLDSLLAYAQLLSVYRRDRFRSSIKYAQQAVDLYPNSEAALVLLAKYLRLTVPEQKEKSKVLIKKALEINSENAEAHYELGQLLFSENCALAEQEQRNALRLSGEKLAEAWQALGRALKCQGRKPEAVLAFKKYIEIGKLSKDHRLEIEREIRLLNH
jgi:tetratricopeptide (TPR) repeat protein